MKRPSISLDELVDSRTKRPSLFVRVRGGCFHEKGWTFSAPADFSNACFVELDHKDKLVSMEYPPWAKASEDAQSFVRLRPYADAKAALKHLGLMCFHLAGARDGSGADQIAHQLYFAKAWLAMLKHGVGAYGTREDPFAAACHIWGRGRAMDSLNKRGDLNALEEIDCPRFVLLVGEALDAPEPLGTELLE